MSDKLTPEIIDALPPAVSDRLPDGKFAPGVMPKGAVPFQPGQSGNPSGRPKTKAWRNALQKMAEQTDPETGKPNLEAVATKVWEMAKKGDMKAISELGDRFDGKATQLIGGDDEHAPVSALLLAIDGKSGGL